MNAILPEEYQALLREDFYSFMLRCFTELNGGASFLPSWHIEVMAAKLQGVRDGRIKRLIINIPPRHLKSLAASIALPAWLLGHDPHLAIVNVTYGQDPLARPGCPRNCSEALVRDVGAVAVEGGKWEVYIGGAAGSHIRKGDLLCAVDTHEDVLRISGRFMQWYREHAKYKERTYTFVERMGIDRIRAVITADSEGIAAALDEAMETSVSATYDPWLEANAPKTANQFSAPIPAGVE
jgi:Nitrite and sulphite reductase 4Fe-4S domain